ncbi:efflux transporter outer membrane subunit [Pseudomonas sp. LRF_L74]|uniref:efflux transporter outer membrane subunit n=1 Tax=Pseudomonas sp. LRF_L74 TaxID=3369422 RepID=UPI003F5E9284
MLRLLRSGFYRAPLLFCVLLSACIDSHDLVTQSRLADANLLDPGAALNSAQAEAGWPAARWWLGFADPQLDAWMDKALQGSPSMAVALARVRQARALAGVVEADESLQANLDVSMQRKRWPDDSFYGPGELARTSSWNNTGQLGLRYPLDLWGQERNRGEAALDQAHATAVEARLVALELQGNLARSYIALALHYAERDIAEASLKQQQEQADLARERLQRGIGTRLELSRAESGIPEAHRVLDDIEESIALGRNQIAALAGEGPGAGQRLQRPRLAAISAIALPAQVPMDLLGHRPDLVAARWRVAAEARGIEVAQADFYPNIDLLAGIGTSATQGGVLDFLRYDKLTYGIGPALSLPVFDGGRRRSQLGAANAGYDLAVEQYNQALVQALRSVSDSLVRLKSLRQQKHLVGESLEAAQHTLDLALVAQQRGLVDYREVLDSQPLLFERQRQQQRLRADYLMAQVDLLLALGGGLLGDADGPHQPMLSPRPVTLRGTQP